MLSRHSNVIGYEAIRGLVLGGYVPKLVVVSSPGGAFDVRDFFLTAWATQLAAVVRNKVLKRSSLRFQGSIKRLCIRLGIPTLTQRAGSQAALANVIRREEPDLLLILGGWPELLNTEILSIPKISTLNLHPSLLPAFRGGDIHRWQVYHGSRTVGFSFHHVNEKFDAGTVVFQQHYIARSDIIPQELSQELARAASMRVAEVVTDVSTKHVSSTDPAPTSHSRKSSFNRYFPKWDWSDHAFFELDFSDSARRIYNQVRSAAQEKSRYSGFFGRLGGLPLIIRECEIFTASKSAKAEQVGTLTIHEDSRFFVLSCGSHRKSIRLKTVQFGGRDGRPQLPRFLPRLNLNSPVGRNLMKLIIARNGNHFD